MNVSAFIRDYLSVKQQTIPQQKKIYINFKDFVELWKKSKRNHSLPRCWPMQSGTQILLDGNSGSARP